MRISKIQWCKTRENSNRSFEIFYCYFLLSLTQWRWLQCKGYLKVMESSLSLLIYQKKYVFSISLMHPNIKSQSGFFVGSFFLCVISHELLNWILRNCLLPFEFRNPFFHSFKEYRVSYYVREIVLGGLWKLMTLFSSFFHRNIDFRPKCVSLCWFCVSSCDKNTNYALKTRKAKFSIQIYESGESDSAASSISISALTENANKILNCTIRCRKLFFWLSSMQADSLSPFLCWLSRQKFPRKWIFLVSSVRVWESQKNISLINSEGLKWKAICDKINHDKSICRMNNMRPNMLWEMSVICWNFSLCN